MALVRNLMVVLAALSLSACASLMGDEGTWISTDPGFVNCELTGKGFHKTVRTPGEVVLPKDATPIHVSCQATGYRETSHALRTEINPMIAANFVFGSSLGAVFDVINGAAMKYPSRVKIHMEPEQFTDSEARDKWYERYRRAIQDRWNKVIADLEIVCSHEQETPLDCLDELKQARSEAIQELYIIEQRRLMARVGNTEQAQAITD